MTYQPTPRELAAIAAFRGWPGCEQKRWKASLRISWETGVWPRSLTGDQIAALQGLRNAHGPRWLAGYRHPNR